MRHKFQCAERVGNPLEIVTLSVGKVIHRVCLPFSASMWMWVVHYTIDDRVAEVHVGARHINFGTKHHLAFLYLTRVHHFKQTQVLFYRTVTIRTVSDWLGRSALLCGNLLRGLFVNICLALLDQHHGKVPQLLEVV